MSGIPYLGEIAGLLTALLWSLTSIVFTAASKRIGALQVNLYRLPLAFVLLTITYYTVQGNFSMSSEAFFWLTGSGIIGLAIGDTFLFYAMVQIGARLSMVLLALAPPITAFLAYFFLNESLSFIGITGIAITIAGVIWVIAERIPDPGGITKHISAKGIFWGIMAALGQAVGLILAKRGLATEIHPLLATWIRMLGATILIWPFTLLMGKVRNPITMFRNDLSAFRLLLIGVIVGPFLGVTFSLISIKYTYTGIAATLMSTMPVLMIPFVILLEKEIPSLRAILGATITVIGIAVLFLH